MLLQEESHKELSKTNSPDPMAFASEKKKYYEKGKKPTYFCEHRKIAGHFIDRCIKIHGYPTKIKSNKKYTAASTRIQILQKKMLKVIILACLMNNLLTYYLFLKKGMTVQRTKLN